MHRWLTISVCTLAVALLGAGSPLPSTAPSVVVFTLVPSGTATVESAARIAAALAVRLGSGKTIAVKSAPPDVKQADFPDAARKLGVDYYVSGFVSPLGSGYSVALQLVSMASGGIAIWTGTSTLSGTDDVTDAADVVGQVIAARSARNSYGPSGGGAPAAGPAPAPAAPAAPPVAQAPAPSPTPTANPNAGVIVAVLDAVDPSGGTTGVELTYASDAIAASLEKHGVVATRWHRQVPALALSGALLCGETKTTSLLEPSIKTVVSGQDNGYWNAVTIELTGFDCTTHAVSHAVSNESGAFNWQWATDRSIAEIVARYAGKSGSTR